MDVTDTLAPKSDQLDAVELIGGPRTFTVADVTRGNDEQPLQIRFAEFPRVWRPSKGMRRVLAFCWGKESDVWIGRRVTLFCDPTIKFGPDTTGGTRISHLSHIDGVKKIPEILTRGKSKLFTVQPLPDEAPASPAVTAETLTELTATFGRKGIPEDKWLAGVCHYTDSSAKTLDTITEDEARRMLTELQQRPDAEPTP